MPQETKKKTRVWPVLRAYSTASLRYPGTLLLAVLGVAGMQFVSIVIPLYLKQLTDVLSSNTPSAAVVQTLLYILAVYAGLGVVNWISRRV